MTKGRRHVLVNSTILCHPIKSNSSEQVYKSVWKSLKDENFDLKMFTMCACEKKKETLKVKLKERQIYI